MGGDFGMVRLQYDALGRRVSRTRTPIIATDPDKVTAYVNGNQASWQVLAEYDGVGTSANLAATYVYGNYIDEPIQMSRDFDGAGTGTVQNFFYHQDDLFNVVALTAGSGSAAGGGVTVPVEEGQPLSFALGAVVERVIYGDYGAPEFKTAAGGRAGTASVAKSPYQFTGRDWDHEARLYHYRTRYMEPTWGRFTTRDSIGTWGDAGSAGNAFTAFRSTPSRLRDPFGLTADDTGIIPQDFNYTKVPPEDRGLMPSNTRELPKTFEELIDRLRWETDKNGSCIRVLRIDAHGCNGDDEGGNVETACNDGFDIRLHEKQHKKIRDKVKEQFERLGKLMCPGGRIQFVQCGAGKGPAGERLRKTLEDYTGHPVDVWKGPVRWVRPFPLIPGFFEPIPSSFPYFRWDHEKKK